MGIEGLCLLCNSFVALRFVIVTLSIFEGLTAVLGRAAMSGRRRRLTQRSSLAFLASVDCVIDDLFRSRSRICSETTSTA